MRGATRPAAAAVLPRRRTIERLQQYRCAYDLRQPMIDSFRPFIASSLACSFAEFEREYVDGVLAKSRLDLRRGEHGLGHWARVLSNANHLAKAEGVSAAIPSLFALIHDGFRVDDGIDAQHGRRASQWVRDRSGLFHLNYDELRSLAYACEFHSDGLTKATLAVRSDDCLTQIACCWDADRLDLARVGVVPEAQYLCTDTGRLVADRFLDEDGCPQWHDFLDGQSTRYGPSM